MSHKVPQKLALLFCLRQDTGELKLKGLAQPCELQDLNSQPSILQ